MLKYLLLEPEPRFFLSFQKIVKYACWISLHGQYYSLQVGDEATETLL